MKKLFYTFLFQIFLSSHVLGVETIEHNKVVFKNTDCINTDSCDLLQFELDIKSYKVSVVGDMYYGTKTMMSYKTDKVENLKKYAIVQFIRGCHFQAEIRDGKYLRSNVFETKSFGEYISYNILDWSIDSIDTDPIYQSPINNEDVNKRHDHYLWNSVKESYSKKTRHSYGDSTPKYPRLYVKDIPGAAFKETGKKLAWNNSYEFRTCIYKTKDIPIRTTRDDIHFATPIHCLKWSSSFIYNFDKNMMEKVPANIDSCRE